MFQDVEGQDRGKTLPLLLLLLLSLRIKLEKEITYFNAQNAQIFIWEQMTFGNSIERKKGNERESDKGPMSNFLQQFIPLEPRFDFR